MLKKTKISFLIVAFNSEKFIEKCITSLLKNSPKDSEVRVLDNSSSDQTVVKLEKFGKRIELIKSDKNLGFGKANNLLAKEAKGEFLFILNPDTEIKSPIFDELLKFYSSEGKIGLVAPKLILPNGSVQKSVRKLPTVFQAFKEYILGIKNAYTEYAPQGNLPLEVEAVYGAAILINKELFLKIGGFDEKYFVYYEDIDFCRKLSKLGKKVFYYPNAEIIHLLGATETSLDKNKLNYESAIKYHGFLKTLILKLIFKVHGFFHD